ncbi:MAG TPA: class I SAM-dependent methyltransferase [Dehalococcoidia bacterium]|jgi:SAM-dependent MidA family methyltransferase|nr:class I SAM-dependent methyltransferase [Dehalococcoidia bacterium]
MNAEYEIRRRIDERGKITFAEFMDVALYWPQGGYYTGREPVGAQGDFYTSPAVHPAFGALLAVQLFQMWQHMGQPSTFPVCELGAGNGLLSRDITSYAAELPSGFSAALRYVCLEQRSVDSLESGISGTSRVLADGLPFKNLQGCIISNEYLDAFPVHQVVLAGDVLKEVYVGLDGQHLVELTGELSHPGLAKRLDDLQLQLEPWQTVELNLELGSWSRNVTAALDRGFVLTIDYGRPAPDLYDPEQRHRGTLVTYHQHVQTDSPLTLIGQQDITAQVDFTSVTRAGETAGLDTLGMVTQREFLGNLHLDKLQQYLRNHSLTPQQMQANRAGITDLVRLEGLGDFKVLIQSKNGGSPNLWGLTSSPEAADLVERLPVPLLTDSHLSLPDGRNIGGETEFEVFWPFPDIASETPPDS